MLWALIKLWFLAGSLGRSAQTRTIWQSSKKSSNDCPPLHGAAFFLPIRPMVPHGGCDPPALIVGCIELRHIWKGVPRQGTHKRGNLLSVLYLTRYPCRGSGLAFGPWLVTARKGRKMWGNCIYPNILYYKSMSLREWVPQDIVSMYFFV